jgi:hypothetical protein
MCSQLSALSVDDVKEVSSVDQAVIDLVAGAVVWRMPGLDVDSYVPLIDICLPVSKWINRRPFLFVLSCRLCRPIVNNLWPSPTNHLLVQLVHVC